MRAARIHRYGDADVFEVEEAPRPTCLARDVLVAVKAAALNPVDYKIRMGTHRLVRPRSMPTVLGLDFSGVVVEVGTKVTRFQVGDEVFGSPNDKRPGTYAELVAVDEAELAHKPKRLSHVEAASIPLVGLTAWRALVQTAKVQPEEKVFIQAGSGGVGTFAIQLAKHLGATVATTCSSRNHELVERLGADIVIDYRSTRFEDVLKDYDVVLESLGGDAMVRARSVLKPGGRLVYITTGLPESVERRGAVVGTLTTVVSLVSFNVHSRLRGVRATMVVRSPDGEALAEIAKLVDEGVISPVVERTFALEKISEAHRTLESKRVRGKVVLDMTLGAGVPS